MNFKSLDNVTRSQIKEMDYGALEGLINSMTREMQAEEWRKMILKTLDAQEEKVTRVIA